MRRVIPALLLSVTATCASPFADVPSTRGTGGPSRALAAPASPAPHSPTQTPAAKGSEGKGETAPDRDKTGSSDRSTETSPAPRPTTPDFRIIGSLSDPSGDADDGPAFADALEVSIGDDGRSAQIVVRVAGTIPNKTRRTEVVGLGVDLYRDDGDYQLFASGEPDGWFGYLYTPDGFVTYEGTFEVDAAKLVFTVPWTSIGGRGAGDFSLFLDWSASGDRFSQDVAPSSGRAAFDP